MIIIPAQSGTYRHSRRRVTDLLAESGLSSRSNPWSAKLSATSVNSFTQLPTSSVNFLPPGHPGYSWSPRRRRGGCRYCGAFEGWLENFGTYKGNYKQDVRSARRDRHVHHIVYGFHWRIWGPRRFSCEERPGRR